MEMIQSRLKCTFYFFQDFIDMLPIEYEDVFIRLLHDSLKGGCKEWLNNLSLQSMGSLMDFCEIFLNVWTNKKEFREEEVLTYLSYPTVRDEITSTGEGFDSVVPKRKVNKAYVEIQEDNIPLMSPQEGNQELL